MGIGLSHIAGIILGIIGAEKHIKHNASIIGEISSITDETFRKFQLQQTTQREGLTCLEFQIMSS